MIFILISYQCMIEASPSKRPSAKQILSHPVICPSTQKSKVSPLILDDYDCVCDIQSNISTGSALQGTE